MHLSCKRRIATPLKSDTGNEIVFPSSSGLPGSVTPLRVTNLTSAADLMFLTVSMPPCSIMSIALSGIVVSILFGTPGCISVKAIPFMWEWVHPFISARPICILPVGHVSIMLSDSTRIFRSFIDTRIVSGDVSWLLNRISTLRMSGLCCMSSGKSSACGIVSAKDVAADAANRAISMNNRGRGCFISVLMWTLQRLTPHKFMSGYV